MTHAYLGLAAFDVTVAAVGYVLLWALGFVPRVRQVGLAFFAGWALLGVLASYGLMVDIDATTVPGTLVLAVAVGAACVFLRRFFPAEPRPWRAPDRDVLLRGVSFAGLGLLVVGLVAAFFFAVRQAADPRWDVWAVWLPKAKAIYFFHGLSTGFGGFTTYGNPDYPPFIPAVVAQSFHFMGGAHTALLPLQETIIGALWAAAVVALLAHRVQRWLLYPVLALVVLAPDFWTRLATVLPDQTVAYFIALGAVCAVLWLEEQRHLYLVLGTVFLSAAALTKDEGFSLGAVLVAVVLVVAFVQRRRRALPALSLAIAPALIEPWHLWLSAHHVTAKAEHYRWSWLFDFNYLSRKYWRFEYALPKMLGFLFYGGHWSFLCPLVVVSLVAIAWRLRALAAAVALWLVLGFFGLAAVYWIGTYNVYWYVGYSAHRVVATLPLVAGTLLPLLLSLALERSGDAAPAAEVVRERDLGEEHAALAAAH